jgi:hypothetical protein
MKTLFVISALLVALILVCGCTGTTADPIVPAATQPTTVPPTTAGVTVSTPNVQDHTFTQTITFSDENGTTVITKNKLVKTATIDATLTLNPPPDGFNRTRYYDLLASVTGNVMQMALFNQSALAELEAQVEQWNAQEWTVEDDSPPGQRETEPGENPLDGYTVTRATIQLLERGTEAGIADIVITGPGKEDVAITYL